MAGAGRRTFQPGEVLTASNVNSYLMDQSVMRFASSAARGSAVGTAIISEGMVSYLDDADALEFYSGTAWTRFAAGTGLPIANGGTGGTTVAQAQDNLGISFVNIVAPTVNVSGGTATANTLGEVTFSTATSISLNNVFSSSYSAYKMILRITAATVVNAQINFRYRVSGTDNSGAVYTWGGVYGNSISQTGALSGNGGTSQNIGNVTNTSGSNLLLVDAVISNVATTSHTGYSSTFAFDNGSSYFGGALGGIHRAATAYDGITIFLASGNFTGSVQILGINS